MELKRCENCNRKQALINYRKERNICNFCWGRGIKTVETKKQIKPYQPTEPIYREQILKNAVVEAMEGVYKITNKKLNKVYIGQSKNLKSRCDHYKFLSGYINPNLKKDLESYKSKYFTFEVLEYLPNTSNDFRLEREAFHKAKYQPYELYNLIIGKEDTEGYERYKASLVEGIL